MSNPCQLLQSYKGPLIIYVEGGGKKDGGQGYFRLARGGGLNFCIKKFRGGGGQQFERKVYFPNFQIFLILFVPVIL